MVGHQKIKRVTEDMVSGYERLLLTLENPSRERERVRGERERERERARGRSSFR